MAIANIAQIGQIADRSDLNGTATLYLQGMHVSIEVQYGANALHTEQVYEDVPGLPTTIAIAKPAGPGAGSLTLALPDARSALNYSQSMIGQPTGPYDFNSNSCLTYCGNVLRAGGLDVPDTTKDLRRFLQGFR